MSKVADQPVAREPRSGARDPITTWLFLVSGLVIVMILVGGYVRLSRAGLSIVEWDVFSGVLPPIGEEAWDEAFAAYQLTPEYILVNQGMTMEEFQWIYYLEWSHRLIARVVGLIVVIPLIWFMVKRYITVRESIRYWGVAALFAFQGLLGWLMVSSGLESRPMVNHYRLTIHLLAALTLLGITMWMAYNRLDAEPSRESSGRLQITTSTRILSWALLASVILQISYGGLVAGLRAGYLSNTWPLMYGQLIPEGIFSTADSWLLSLVEPTGANWTHRWLAFVVAGLAVATAISIRRGGSATRRLETAANWLLVAVLVQLTLGVLVVLLSVPKWIALAHQGVGVLIFCAAITISHEVWAAKRSTPREVAVSA